MAKEFKRKRKNGQRGQAKEEEEKSQRCGLNRDK